MSAPRVGFLGAGWIGSARLQALRESGLVEIAGVCDSDPAALAKAIAASPGTLGFDCYADLLARDLDGVVIATPSGLHAAQCVAAFERGAAVFCQKPLAPTLLETRAVLDAARAADRLLAVDFCYRETAALRRAREVVRSGEIGQPFAVELVFHNAYGPDQSWARDPDLAGGGCLLDLGVHLIDAALWFFDHPPCAAGSSRLLRAGAPLRDGRELEDFASGSLTLPSGAVVSFACSWRSAFGKPAEIRARVFGTRGGVAFENVEGSFYDFKCELYHGPERQELVAPPDAWGGRAIVRWAEQLRASRRHRSTDDLLAVAEALDALDARPRAGRAPQRAAEVEAVGTP